MPRRTLSTNATATAPSVLSEQPLLSGYKPEAAIYDEMMLPSGELRPHWQAFGDFLKRCGHSELSARKESIQRLLRDHGVTFNVYDSDMSASRPWSLDLLPFIVARDDWQRVQQGLAQRARLLNAIVADLYGPQRLLHDGLLPPRLAHANPAFLRAVVGVSPAGGRWIFSMACDLVRGPDGRWLVLAHRTQAPSGHGYTLENRIIMANVFPEEFTASRIHRLAAYYDHKREMLRSLAPKRRQGTAGILMLTPGPANETYFEHAFQARYLGFPLVEGADLTTRDRSLYLKTLEGLRRVDVMVRHLDDTFCDPLELSSGSLLGVPGMVEAWRSGNIALANGLGTGIVETPALHPFLPKLCKELLGEELLMPCVATRWCGQPHELQAVLAEPDRWIVKPAFQPGGENPVFMAELAAEPKARMLETILAAPHEWVAQEVLKLSTTPTWTGDQIEPRSLVWRTFAIANGDNFTLMPGGLTRVSPDAHRWMVTIRAGGVSKDTWVIAESPADATPPAVKPPPVIRPARPPSGVPSRAADHLYWLGRYSERLEQTIRLVRTTLQRSGSEHSEYQHREVQSCVALLAAMELVPKATPRLKDHLQSLLSDPKRAGGIPRLINRVRFNAGSARDRLSDDTWRIFNRIERDAKLPDGPVVTATAMGMLDTLVLDLAAVSGMQQENMTRGHGWRFLEIGRRIERASITLTLIRAATHRSATDDSVLGPLLEICDSSMTFRRLHYARPTLIPVLDLLMFNEPNPRSVAHQLNVLGRQTPQLPADPSMDTGGREHHQTDRLQSDLAAISLGALANNPADIFHGIPAVCATLSRGLETLSTIITEHYFSHAIRKAQ